MTNELDVLFCKFAEGDIIALFPSEKADNQGNILSYQHLGQHGAASPDLQTELAEAKLNEFWPLLDELIARGYNNLNVLNSQTVEYRRQPTLQEINFGHGATHYKDFPLTVAINRKGGDTLKRRLKCPHDGLQYYR